MLDGKLSGVMRLDMVGFFGYFLYFLKISSKKEGGDAIHLLNLESLRPTHLESNDYLEAVLRIHPFCRFPKGENPNNLPYYLPKTPWDKGLPPGHLSPRTLFV